ncbi:hypothetical protein HK096_003271, partial [Nowakowskiella sp. JEL0078]
MSANKNLTRAQGSQLLHSRSLPRLVNSREPTSKTSNVAGQKPLFQPPNILFTLSTVSLPPNVSAPIRCFLYFAAPKLYLNTSTLSVPSPETIDPCVKLHWWGSLPSTSDLIFYPVLESDLIRRASESNLKSRLLQSQGLQRSGSTIQHTTTRNSQLPLPSSKLPVSKLSAIRQMDPKFGQRGHAFKFPVRCTAQQLAQYFKDIKVLDLFVFLDSRNLAVPYGAVSIPLAHLLQLVGSPVGKRKADVLHQNTPLESWFPVFEVGIAGSGSPLKRGKKIGELCVSLRLQVNEEFDLRSSIINSLESQNE